MRTNKQIIHNIYKLIDDSKRKIDVYGTQLVFCFFVFFCFFLFFFTKVYITSGITLFDITDHRLRYNSDVLLTNGASIFNIAMHSSE